MDPWIQYRQLLTRTPYTLLRFVFSPLVCLLWIRSIIGSEYLHSVKPAIFVANHASYFDFLCITAIAPQNIYFLCAEKLFCHPFWCIPVRLTQQIRVNRYSKEKQGVYDRVKKHINHNDIIGIFPEGTRSRDGSMGKSYPGAIRFAITHDIPIIPISLSNTHQIMAPHHHLPRFKKIIDIVVGPPIYYSHYKGKLPHSETLQREIDQVMEEIKKLQMQS